MGRAFVQHMEMKIEASREAVLTALKENRTTHLKILEEANVGYLLDAKKALSKRLKEIKSGKPVSLHFNFQPPVSYLDAYDTAIQMLELHQSPTIELSATEVRCLMMDEWEWKESFLLLNSAYSSVAASAYEGIK